MRAVVKTRPGPGFELMDVEMPIIGDKDVLIKVKAVGICGSDIPIFNGIRPVPIPFIPGHEFSGIIVEKGKDVLNFQVGDRVSPGLVINCGYCEPCRAGLESLCDHILETGIHVNGAFAEYVAVPEQTLHHLPEGMSFEEGASIDPIASAYRPVKKAHIGSEDRVAIFGPGPIGLYAMQIAKTEGARTVLMIGLPGDESRLSLAKSLGCDATIIYRPETFMDEVKAVTEGNMVDAVIEATGSHHVFPTCLDIMKKGGRLVVAGIVHANSEISFARIVRSELKIEGSICYTWKEYRESLDLVRSKRIQVTPLITHRLPLDQIGLGLDGLARRDAIKVMLLP